VPALKLRAGLDVMGSPHKQYIHCRNTPAVLATGDG